MTSNATPTSNLDELRYGKIVHAGYLNKRSSGCKWPMVWHLLCISFPSDTVCDETHHQRYAVLWEDMALRFYETEARGDVLGKIKVLFLYVSFLTQTQYIDCIQMQYVSDIRELEYQQAVNLDPNQPYFFCITSSESKKTWVCCMSSFAECITE